VLKHSTAIGVAVALLSTTAFAQASQRPPGPRPPAQGVETSPLPQPDGPTASGLAPQPPAGARLAKASRLARPPISASNKAIRRSR
jgi:hypothetical protein